MTVTDKEIISLSDEKLQQAFTNAALTYFVHQDLCWQLMKEIIQRGEKAKFPDWETLKPSSKQQVTPPAQPLNDTSTVFQGTVQETQ